MIAPAILLAALGLAQGIPAGAKLQEEGNTDSRPPLQPYARFSPLVWLTAPHGRLTLDTVFGTSTGDESTAPKIDLEDEAFLGNRSSSIEFELQVFFFGSDEEERPGFIAGIQASSQLNSWMGSGTLSAPLDLGITVIPAGSSVESTFELRTYSLDLIGSWEPPEYPDIRYELWMGLGLVNTDLKMEVPGGTLLDDTGSAPVDFGARGRWDFSPPFFAMAEVQVTIVGLLVFDAAVSVGTEWEGIPLEISYRRLWTSLDTSKEQTRYSFDGFTIGFSYTF